jgi:ABC-2 type transport system ATP-binding protein
VLDEPANGLDPEGIAWLRNFLRSFADNGGTVLISSHLLAELESFIDQAVIISRGTTVFAGHLDELRARQPQSVTVNTADNAQFVKVLRDNNINNVEPSPDGHIIIHGMELKPIADLAAANGVSIYQINENRANLEQLYFQLTAGQYGGAPMGPPYYGGPPSGPYGGQPPQQGWDQTNGGGLGGRQ